MLYAIIRQIVKYVARNNIYEISQATVVCSMKRLRRCSCNLWQVTYPGRISAALELTDHAYLLNIPAFLYNI